MISGTVVQGLGLSYRVLDCLTGSWTVLQGLGLS